MPFAIIVHGGAWSIPDEHLSQSLEGVRAAAVEGHGLLSEGRSAVDAVEAAVASLEDNIYFNAGTGASLNLDGEVEMDAMIMDGQDLNAGAVGAVKRIRNPVKLSRLVMEKTAHTLVVGEGATRLARDLGVSEVANEDLVVPHERREFEIVKNFCVTRDVLYRGGHGHDTVGACALDSSGHVACAVSTGGLTAKLPGRVGDSPMIGAGGYADDASGAVACTGHGESISKAVLAYRITNLIEQGHSADEATKRALLYMKDRLGRYGGAVTVDAQGKFGRYFTTERMAWASASGEDESVEYGINPGDLITEPISTRL